MSTSTYLLLIGVPLVLGLYAQMRVSGAFGKYKKVAASSGVTGAQAAREILNAAQIHDVEVREINDMLGDHYDPSKKRLCLSSDVFHTPSVAALGIAAHEAGHALQDAQGYALMSIRNAAVGVANFGSGLGLLVFMIGLGMALKPIAWLGIVLFAGTVFFQLVNLPVEIDASNRAKAALVNLGVVPAAEMPAVNSVLNAAAWTYVAATLQSVLTLLYYASYLTGGSNDDR